jgi:hypothetical protein
VRRKLIAEKVKKTMNRKRRRVKKSGNREIDSEKKELKAQKLEKVKRRQRNHIYRV